VERLPPLSGHRYSPTYLSWVQRLFLELSCLRMRGPIRQAINRYRRQIGLSAVRELPTNSHTCHTLHNCRNASNPRALRFRVTFTMRDHSKAPQRGRRRFPWNRLDGRPLIYATLGTTRSVRQLSSAHRRGVPRPFTHNWSSLLGIALTRSPLLMAGQPVVVGYALNLNFSRSLNS